MRTSEYRSILADQLGTTLALTKRKRLRVTSAKKLSRDAKLALDGYRESMIDFLRSGKDQELETLPMHSDLEALGFTIRLPDGTDCHPDGHEAENLILAGVVSRADARQAAARRKDRLKETENARPFVG